MSRSVTLPTGEVLDQFESSECWDYMESSGTHLLSDIDPNHYFRERLGPDWLQILRAEAIAIEHVKGKYPEDIPSSHKVAFVGKEGNEYVFHSDGYIGCPCDPGPVDETVRVCIAMSIVDDKAPEHEELSGFARIGRWMYKNL